MAKFSVLLDACTLVPISLADTLLSLAEAGLYRPLWSNRILGEVSGAIQRIHPDLPPAFIDKRLQAMTDFFADANVHGWEPLEGALQLPDPNDAHVLATAIQGRADAIVTSNIKDFPRSETDRFGIDVQSPEEFLLNQLDLDADEVMNCLKRQAESMQNPEVGLDDLLAHLEKVNLPGFAFEARKHLWRVL